ncbi:hypothetical protein GOP47_0002173 [Adiantum capillus-veneris]|uniref:Uncharacterized protein n=1 Tax=Adiantum capillus-veneris TaxID=13818 RepID=A0A9D4VAF6_ADICA|nr:hypothetical protein GOP47_0002173 [Adiantum capillus-veneris]
MHWSSSLPHSDTLQLLSGSLQVLPFVNSKYACLEMTPTLLPCTRHSLLFPMDTTNFPSSQSGSDLSCYSLPGISSTTGGPATRLQLCFACMPQNSPVDPQARTHLQLLPLKSGFVAPLTCS